MSVREFFSETGPLSKEFPGYAPRPQQIELSEAIEKSIEEELPLIGEAPTGVGKSFAALVPAFEAIRKYDAPVLVVTSSILLQEQYYNKDVPFLEKLFGMSVNPVLIKGKGNYACLHKTVNGVTTTNSKYTPQIEAINEWVAETKSGDVSELDFVPAYPVWSEFSIVDENECAGKDCPLFEQCFYYNRRREMKSAKLIICNYHYLFTALDNEKMLPPDINVIIMDEGHEISEIARNMQEKSFDQFTYKRLNQMLAKAQTRAKVHKDDLAISEEIELTELMQTHQELVQDVSEFFMKNKSINDEKYVLHPRDFPDFYPIAEVHIEQLKRSIRLLEDYLIETGLNVNIRQEWYNYYSPEIIQWQLGQERYLGGLEDRLVMLERMFMGPKSSDPDWLVWIEDGGPHRGITVKTKPFTSAAITGPIFEADRYKRPLRLMGATPIVISATLSVNGNFRHVQNDLGINTLINECMVSSPFDLNKNLLWYLPSSVVPGNDPSHVAVTIQEMEKVIRAAEGRTLCLFTSNKSLMAAANHFTKVFDGKYDVLVQGQIPKQTIIDRMKENPNTVIVATKSFFTGVDIQGQNLSAVLLDKLPFPMIGDPVNDYLMSSKHGFNKYTLPETVISIKQAFGRLNRTVDDKGIVAIFDKRLATEDYKVKIFRSFSFDVSATRNFSDIETYLEEILNGTRT